MMLHNVNNNQVYRLNSGSPPLCSKPRRKFVQTSYALKVRFIGLSLIRTVKAMLIQSRKPQHTYVKCVVRKAHFKLNRTFKVIQGHPYCRRQESRRVCSMLP